MHIAHMKTVEQKLTDLPKMNLSAIASLTRQDWKKPNFAAVPYLNAMLTMDSINDNFGADTGRSIVSYFLSNSATWKGPVARAVKVELNKRVKSRK
jgi:hypothetical protein